jgi:hypothetical protein
MNGLTKPCRAAWWGGERRRPCIERGPRRSAARPGGVLARTPGEQLHGDRKLLASSIGSPDRGLGFCQLDLASGPTPAFNLTAPDYATGSSDLMLSEVPPTRLSGGPVFLRRWPRHRQRHVG